MNLENFSALGAVFIGAVVFFFIMVLWLVVIYNGLVKLRNRFQNAWAQIDVQLKRRYDLIPNLVETAKGYLKHEHDTLEAVIAARSGAFSANQNLADKPGDPEAMAGLVAAEGTLTGALGRLMVLSENYPDLKADKNMRSLQEELTSTENKVAFSRQAYNDAVMSFNTARESFPDLLVAGPFGFTRAESYELQDKDQRDAPKVSFA
jgi:LemA protein